MLSVSRAVIGVVIVFGATRLASAQSVVQRVGSSDGLVEVTYPSRSGVCGDGRGSIHLFGHSDWRVNGSSISISGGWNDRPCIHGPARVLADVSDGRVVALHTYVGPNDRGSHASRTLTVSAADATAWLNGLASGAEGHVASDAIVALLVADAPEPWPLLLRVSRDENASRTTRKSALFWLGEGAIDKLGLADAASETADDEVRDAAVFSLAQHRKTESVPDLIDLARNAKRPSVRRAAIFWLGESGDPRAADVYADLLGIR